MQNNGIWTREEILDVKESMKKLKELLTPPKKINLEDVVDFLKDK